MAQYGSQDDWMSKTLLKHYLASVIQVGGEDAAICQRSNVTATNHA
jgi:hypothetical protein